MFIKHLNDCPEFEAGDKTILKEVAHPSNDGWPIGYSLAHARLPVGAASLPHRLKSSELYYILEGEGLMHIDGEEKKVAKGTVLLVPGAAEQYIKNTGSTELVFLCIVEPFWQEVDEKVG
jgi:mannose-6-phosphate isomerase-like protein (cupin superfamily)